MNHKTPERVHANGNREKPVTTVGLRAENQTFDLPNTKQKRKLTLQTSFFFWNEFAEHAEEHFHNLTRLPSQRTPGHLSSRIKRPDSETDHS